MLMTPNCYKRNCIYFLGTKGKEEKSQRNICMAFPKGIPFDIVDGKNLHSTIQKGQVSNYIYVKKPENI